MPSIHQIWQKPSCKAQWTAEEGKADKGRYERTTSGNGQAQSSKSPRGQWRIRKNGGNWVWNHLWRPNNPWGSGIDDGDIWCSLLKWLVSGLFFWSVSQSATDVVTCKTAAYVRVKLQCDLFRSLWVCVCVCKRHLHQWTLLVPVIHVISTSYKTWGKV